MALRLAMKYRLCSPQKICLTQTKLTKNDARISGMSIGLIRHMSDFKMTENISPVSSELSDGIACIRFSNYPDGVIDGKVVSILSKLLDKLESDSSVRCLVFTGQVPGVFIRHYSVGDLVDAAERVTALAYDDVELARRAARPTELSRCFDKVASFAKPTIAAINGLCQGGGYEFALCCDLRIAQEGDYQIGLPEIRLGIMPGAGGTQRLSRLIGEARALEMILLGKTVGPREAVALGLVTELVPSAIDRAWHIARTLAGQSPSLIRDIKAVINGTSRRPLSEGLVDERQRVVVGLRDPAALRRMRAFISGQTPIASFPPGDIWDERDPLILPG